MSTKGDQRHKVGSRDSWAALTPRERAISLLIYEKTDTDDLQPDGRVRITHDEIERRLRDLKERTQ